MIDYNQFIYCSLLFHYAPHCFQGLGRHCMHEQVEVLRVLHNRMSMRSSTDLPTEVHVLRDGDHFNEQTLRMLLHVDSLYESTYREAHKGEFERLHSLVQRPEARTFMHTDLSWARQIRMKGRRTDLSAAVSVAYILWARVQDFMKGEAARIDAPCKFVCQGTPSNEQGKLASIPPLEQLLCRHQVCL